MIPPLQSRPRLRATPPGAILSEWVSVVRASHEAKPLLAADQRNCRRALEALGQETEWLDPPKVEEEEGAAVAAAAEA